MIKYLLIWLLANYSYDNVVKTYNAYNSENTFSEMRNFIKDQQYREDKLREECNLQLYKIAEKPSIYYSIKQTYYDISLLVTQNLIPTLKLNVPSIYIMETTLKTNSLDEFYKLSYDKDNINKEVEFNGQMYTIIYSGVKVDSSIYRSYSNQQYLPEPQKPMWTIILGNNTLTISNIQ